jgi:hypothetical protein
MIGFGVLGMDYGDVEWLVGPYMGLADVGISQHMQKYFVSARNYYYSISPRSIQSIINLYFPKEGIV